VNLILPQRFDNTHRGHPAALWILGLVLVAKTGIALGTIFNGHTAAQSADGIPLDTFGTAGAEAVLTLFAMWGLSQLVLSVLGVLTLVRYRAMTPLMFLLILVEHVARRWILFVKPIARIGAPPGLSINLVLLGLTVVGLALSLWRRQVLPEGP
jgi:hypothetical protein